MQLWLGLAPIVIVRTRAQMALAGHDLNIAAIVRIAIGLPTPLGMLQIQTA